MPKISFEQACLDVVGDAFPVETAVQILRKRLDGGAIDRFVGGLEGDDFLLKYIKASQGIAVSGRVYTHKLQSIFASLASLEAQLEADPYLSTEHEQTDVGNIKGAIHGFRQGFDPTATADLPTQQTLGAMDPSHDRFSFDEKLKPAGMAYEWKRASFRGDENYYMANYKKAGWRCVPPARHPELHNQGDAGRILLDEMVLMEIPIDIWAELRSRALSLAKDQVVVHGLQFEGEGLRVLPMDKKDG